MEAVKEKKPNVAMAMDRVDGLSTAFSKAVGRCGAPYGLGWLVAIVAETKGLEGSGRHIGN